MNCFDHDYWGGRVESLEPVYVCKYIYIHTLHKYVHVIYTYIHINYYIFFVQPLMLRKFMLDNYIVSSVARISVDTAVAKLQHLVEKLCGQGDQDEQAAWSQNLTACRWPKSCWNKQHQLLPPRDSWITRGHIINILEASLTVKPPGRFRKWVTWKNPGEQFPFSWTLSCSASWHCRHEAESIMLPKWNVMVVEKSMFCMYSPRMVHIKGWTDQKVNNLVDNQKTQPIVLFRHQLLECLFQASSAVEETSPQTLQKDTWVTSGSKDRWIMLILCLDGVDCCWLPVSM